MNRGITIGSVAIALLIFAGVSIGLIAMIGDVTSNYDTRTDSTIQQGSNLSEYEGKVTGLQEELEGFSSELESSANSTEAGGGETTANLVWFGITNSFRIKGVVTSLFGVIGGVMNVGGTALHLPNWATALTLTAFGIVIAILLWRVILSESRI